jgi:hypothetical protein
MDTATKVWIGLGLAVTAVAVGLGVYEETKSSPAASAPVKAPPPHQTPEPGTGISKPGNPAPPGSSPPYQTGAQSWTIQPGQSMTFTVTQSVPAVNWTNNTAASLLVALGGAGTLITAAKFTISNVSSTAETLVMPATLTFTVTASSLGPVTLTPDQITAATGGTSPSVSA